MRRVLLLGLWWVGGCSLLTGAFAEECGDGFIQTGETCDDGDVIGGDGCSADCLLEDGVCGDSTIDANEQCDDGNAANGDGCSSLCLLEICGDGILNATEECDDNNLVNGDGCSSDCVVEIPVNCGDGAIDAGEQCDDNNNNNGDGCSAQCVNEFCGDSVVNQDSITGLVDECDDGNTIDGDNCDSNCTFTVCGNGVPTTGEGCDDGNDVNGDGCDSSCQVEGSPDCGNSVTDPNEDCDDGNIVNGDNCSSQCQFPDIREVQVGLDHTCIRDEFGSVKCWGFGDFGQLGRANTDEIGDGEPPSSIGMLAVGVNVAALTAGDQFVCVESNNGNARCWGRNNAGQLGNGNNDDIGDTEDLSGVLDIGSVVPVIALSAGGEHTCALSGDGSVRCWGQNESGQLGVGSTADRSAPDALGILGLSATKIEAGGAHTCALKSATELVCWGENASGQLGIGSTTDVLAPPSEELVFTGGVLQVSLGAAHTCVLLVGGAIKCWGAGGNGRLGSGNTNDLLVPPQNPLDTGGAIALQISAGAEHTCAVMADATLRCWGKGADGRLGLNNSGDRTLPNGELPFIDEAIQVSAGGQHTCALFSTGKIRCWGKADRGQLGYGNTTAIGDNAGSTEMEDLGFVPVY